MCPVSCLRVATLTLAYVMLWSSQAADAAPPVRHRIECPAELGPDSLQISPQENGWTAFVRNGLRLSSAEPMVGPPSEKGFLKPTISQETAGKGFDKWTELDGYMPESKWIACSYGARNELMLAKRIDDNTSECTVRYVRDRQGLRKLDISCMW